MKPEKPTINFEDFSKVDIRIGTIIAVSEFKKARKPSYQLKIDFGNLGVKNSSAQITDLYTMSDLKNKQVLAVINFPKKQIANFFSECLVLGIYNAKNQVVLLQSSKTIIKNGEQVS
jgi:tRNA-binding protein